MNQFHLTRYYDVSLWCMIQLFSFGTVHDIEYGFGAHEHSTTGVFEVEPKQCPGFQFRKSILIGRTDLGPKEVRVFMEKLAEYSGNTYHLITKNCNHFCNDVCLKLTGKPIPRWVNRLARLGEKSLSNISIFFVAFFACLHIISRLFRSIEESRTLIFKTSLSIR